MAGQLILSIEHLDVLYITTCLNISVRLISERINLSLLTILPQFDTNNIHCNGASFFAVWQSTGTTLVLKSQRR